MNFGGYTKKLIARFLWRRQNKVIDVILEFLSRLLWTYFAYYSSVLIVDFKQLY